MDGEPNLSEEALSASFVAQIREGETAPAERRAAEDALYRHYVRRITYVVARMVNDKSLVDDIVQNTFITCLEKLRSGALLDDKRLGAFVYGIAKNKVREERAREQRRPQSSESDADSLPDPDFDVAAIIDRGRRSRLLEECIAACSEPRDREILQRYAIYEQDKPVICAALNVSAAHFDRVLYRAKNRLKTIAQARLEQEGYR